MKRATLCIITLIFALLAPPWQQASAASAYDNYYHTADRVLVSSQICQPVDLTTSYDTYLNDSSYWGQSDNQGYSWLTAQRNSFNTAKSNGGRWGLSVRYGHSSWAGNGVYRAVYLYWTEDDSLSLVWDGANQRIAAYSTNGSGQMHSVLIQTEGVRQGTANCDVRAMPYDATTTLVSTQSRTMPTSDAELVVDNIFVTTDHTNYPAGYEGSYILTAPELPPTTVYNGSIDCGNDTIEYLLITQNGVTNPVPLTYTSTYTADWSYSLTNNPYSITVGCGNSLAASYGSVSPITSSNDWICDTVHNPHYCVLK